MAMKAIPAIIGIDVAKAELAVFRADLDRLELVDNTRQAIATWLATLPAASALAVEATNVYHLELVEQAHACGLRVYVIDGYRLNHYRKGTGGRAKTDASDARLLARYLTHEGDRLQPWSPPPPAYRRLQQQLRRRAALVKTRVALKQSFAEPALAAMLKPVLVRIQQLEKQLERALLGMAHDAGLTDSIKRCRTLEGVGPLTACALNMAYLRGQFRHSDAFIAFLGLDVRVRDSGRRRGRRTLTKQGDPELRRLLHNAAMAASRSTTWRPFYQRHLDRGLTRTQALVALARKLARIAFALMKSKSEYQPQLAGCGAT
jgi:transposase